MSIPISPETICLAAATKALPGPVDLIDLRDSLGTIGKGRYRLRAAHHVDLVHTAELGCCKRVGTDKPILLRRRDHDHALDPCDLGGNSVHEYRRGILRASARHVDASRSKRGHLDAEHGAIRARGKPALLDLALVELANLYGGLLERRDKRGVQTLKRRIDLLLRQTETLKVNTVKTAAIVAHCRVSLGAHAGHDLLGRSHDILGQHALAIELVDAQQLARCQLDGLHLKQSYLYWASAPMLRQNRYMPATEPSPQRARNGDAPPQRPAALPGHARVDPGEQHRDSQRTAPCIP